MIHLGRARGGGWSTSPEPMRMVWAFLLLLGLASVFLVSHVANPLHWFLPATCLPDSARSVAMFDHVAPPAVASPARGVKWAHLGVFALVSFTLGCLVVVFVTRRNSGSELLAEAGAPSPAAPAHSEAKAGTEVEIGTAVALGAWRVVADNTHDVKDAGHAGITPDHRDAVIFPGGELALADGDGGYMVDGPGNALIVHGTSGDKTPYTVFVRADAADPWTHLDANRTGFPQGVGSHNIRKPRIRQLKIRNDGTTNLFVDAIGVASQPRSIAGDRAATPRPAPIAQPVTVVPLREPATPTAVSIAEAAASKPVDSPVSEAAPTSTTPSPPQAEPSSPASGAAGPVRAPDTAARATSAGPLDPPRQIRRVPANYPKVAELANVEGTVVIEAVIDVDGKVTSPRVVKSIRLLDQAALDAVNNGSSPQRRVVDDRCP